ncbi:MAG: glycosyltransferase [Acidobacteriota bacterium]
MSQLSTLLVIPCYNEGQRLDFESVSGFLETRPHIGLVPVDDGSTDDTASILERWGQSHERIHPLTLERNAGKAEAVRRGVLEALARQPDCVGYWDADLATPLEAVDDFLIVMMAQPELRVILGSRVALVGRHIERSRLRHYVGRIFATAAARTLKLMVYDTQCGAKLLRNTPRVRAAFEPPFLSNWAFDVELLARLLVSSEGSSADADAQLWELPLRHWRDVTGSKVKPLDLPKSLLELRRIRRSYPGLSSRS